MGTNEAGQRASIESHSAFSFDLCLPRHDVGVSHLGYMSQVERGGGQASFGMCGYKVTLTRYGAFSFFSLLLLLLLLLLCERAVARCCLVYGAIRLH